MERGENKGSPSAATGEVREYKDTVAIHGGIFRPRVGTRQKHGAIAPVQINVENGCSRSIK